jgi:hypothetical protein
MAGNSNRMGLLQSWAVILLFVASELCRRPRWMRRWLYRRVHGRTCGAVVAAMELLRRLGDARW